MNLFKKSFAAALVVALFGLAGCGGESGTTAQPEGNSPAGNAPATAEPAAITGKVPVTMETSMGTIELELDADKAPLTVANFVNYARKGHYDGTVFHRVISDFMIQGGGFTEDLKEKPTEAPIKNEGQNGLKNERGTIAMARTSDPDSATSQFFINVEDNTTKLDYPNPDGYGYAVFGKVTKGMDVVDKIRAVQTSEKSLTQRTDSGQEITQMAGDVPVENVVIKSVKVGEPSAAGTDPDGGETAAEGGNAPAAAGNTPAEGEKKTQ